MFNPTYEAQARLLIECLPHVAKQECFALKGGTAINLFLHDLPRISVDIDLTYLPLKSRDKSLREISLALQKSQGRHRKVYLWKSGKRASHSRFHSPAFNSDSASRNQDRAKPCTEGMCRQSLSERAFPSRPGPVWVIRPDDNTCRGRYLWRQTMRGFGQVAPSGSL